MVGSAWLTGWDLLAVQGVVLLTGFAIAAVEDVRKREVSDQLWIAMTLVGGGVLVLGTSWANLVGIGFDVLLILFVLEHLIPWDEGWADHPGRVLVVEGTIYAGVVLLMAWGLLQSVAPVTVVAGILVVLFARGLFEAGLLYGGADAKALMVVAVVLPILLPAPLLVGLPSVLSTPPLIDIPFAFTVLTDGAILALAAPIVLFAWNLQRGDRVYSRMFTTFEIPTEELPRRFVWLKEPPSPHDEHLDTTEEDEQLRRAQCADLLARGVTRVRVAPQLPLLVAFAAGALLGLFVGNILFWILAVLP